MHALPFPLSTSPSSTNITCQPPSTAACRPPTHRRALRHLSARANVLALVPGHHRRLLRQEHHQARSPRIARAGTPHQSRPHSAQPSSIARHHGLAASLRPRPQGPYHLLVFHLQRLPPPPLPAACPLPLAPTPPPTPSAVLSPLSQTRKYTEEYGT
eukprot:6187758-Pleurochrysis_carterae.AAC.1